VPPFFVSAMNEFILDQRLADDCHELGMLELCKVLLMNNASVSWLILVPQCSATELTELNEADQAVLLAEINKIAGFLESIPAVEKLNIAALGNVVSQLHVHVIGRNSEDACWPDPVWGRLTEAPYDSADVRVMAIALAEQLGPDFLVNRNVIV